MNPNLTKSSNRTATTGVPSHPWAPFSFCLFPFLSFPERVRDVRVESLRHAFGGHQSTTWGLCYRRANHSIRPAFFFLLHLLHLFVIASPIRAVPTPRPEIVWHPPRGTFSSHVSGLVPPHQSEPKTAPVGLGRPCESCKPATHPKRSSHCHQVVCLCIVGSRIPIMFAVTYPHRPFDRSRAAPMRSSSSGTGIRTIALL